MGPGSMKVDRGKQLVVIKSLVADGHMDFSKKVHRYIGEGWYGTEDLRACILSATSIQKVEEDEMGEALDCCKYTILGRDTLGYPFYTCGKILLNRNNERLYFFITAHESK